MVVTIKRFGGEKNVVGGVEKLVDVVAKGGGRERRVEFVVDVRRVGGVKLALFDFFAFFDVVGATTAFGKVGILRKIVKLVGRDRDAVRFVAVGRSGRFDEKNVPLRFDVFPDLVARSLQKIRKLNRFLFCVLFLLEPVRPFEFRAAFDGDADAETWGSWVRRVERMRSQSSFSEGRWSERRDVCGDVGGASGLARRLGVRVGFRF